MVLLDTECDCGGKEPPLTSAPRGFLPPGPPSSPKCALFRRMTDGAMRQLFPAEGLPAPPRKDPGGGQSSHRGGHKICRALLLAAFSSPRRVIPGQGHRAYPRGLVAKSHLAPTKARWGEGGEFEGREDRSRASRGVLPPLKPFCLQNAETPAVPPGLRHHISPYQGICRPVMTGTVPPVLPFSAVPADRPPAGLGAAAGPSGAGRPRCRSRP